MIQISTILPSTTWEMVIPATVTGFPVGAMSSNLPVCVPRKVMRVATLFPSAM